MNIDLIRGIIIAIIIVLHSVTVWMLCKTAYKHGYLDGMSKNQKIVDSVLRQYNKTKEEIKKEMYGDV